MSRHENMASWDRQRTRKELRSFIDQKIDNLGEIDDLHL